MVWKQLEPFRGKSPGREKEGKVGKWPTCHAETCSDWQEILLRCIDRLPIDNSRSSSRQTFFSTQGTFPPTFFSRGNLHELLVRFVSETTYFFIRFLDWTLLIPKWFPSLASLFGTKIPHFRYLHSPSTATPPSLNGAEVVKHSDQRKGPWGKLWCITVWRKGQFIRRYCLWAGPESLCYPHTSPTVEKYWLLPGWQWWLCWGKGSPTYLWSATINFIWRPGASVDTAGRGSNKFLTRGPIHTPKAKYLCPCQSSPRSLLPSSSSSSSTCWPTVEGKNSYLPCWKPRSRAQHLLTPTVALWHLPTHPIA